MCLQNILRAGSVIHCRVNTKLRSNPQPRGRLDCDSSYLRFPAFFLHETSGRQQGEEGLGAKVIVDKVVMWSWDENFNLYIASELSHCGSESTAGFSLLSAYLVAAAPLPMPWWTSSIPSSVRPATSAPVERKFLQLTESQWKICLCSENYWTLNSAVWPSSYNKPGCDKH